MVTLQHEIALKQRDIMHLGISSYITPFSTQRFECLYPHTEVLSTYLLFRVFACYVEHNDAVSQVAD